ncbi:MAG: NnrU family protein [Rhodospirillales bacterium]
MSAYSTLILAAAVFVISHLALSARAVRATLIQRLGKPAFLVAYSLVAIGAFTWLLLVYNDAPREYLWIAPTWVRHLPMGIMAVAAIFIAAGYSAANPTAVGLDQLARVADGPKGIFRITRHPILMAIALWALVHIPASGQASGIILQVSVGILAVAGMLQIDRRKAKELGDDWAAYREQSSLIPFAAIAAGRQRFVFSEIGWGRVFAGLALYAALLVAHPFIIGVSPLPMPS